METTVKTPKKQTKPLKNFFKNISEKEKSIITKPKDQTKKEKKPFYKPLIVKKKYSPVFESKIESNKRKKRKIKNRMQKHSRIMNMAS